MKRENILLVLLFVTLTNLAQSKKDIANIYFKKAEKAMEKIDYNTAKIHFDKGLKVIDSANTTAIAQQGAFIYYELKDYQAAKGFAKQFFNLSRSKSSEDYSQMLELYVDMEEKILEKEEEKKRIIAEKKAKEAELKRIDSLKKVWKKKEEKFTLQIDELSNFNKKGIALFKKDDFYGIIDDSGNIIVEADTYTDAKQNEGFFILIDNKKNPEKVYCYNANNEKSFTIIEPYKYKEDLGDYGKITLPRGNGRMVMYPNEIAETLVYDFEEEKFVTIANIKEFFKEFKKNDKIDKYDDKERTIKIDKDWYLFGNHIGGQVYTLYSVENQKLFGYLFANEEDVKVLKKEDVGYLGVYHSNKLNAINSKGEELWLSKDGEEASKPILNNKYKGATKIVKVEKGYQLVKDGNVFLRNETLEKLPDFLRNNSK